MKIKIPNLEGTEQFIENKKSIVLIGANGAGKTRMSVWIDENNPNINIHLNPWNQYITKSYKPA